MPLLGAAVYLDCCAGTGFYLRGPVGDQSSLEAAGGGWGGFARSSPLAPGFCVNVAEDTCVLHSFPILDNTSQKRISLKVLEKPEKSIEMCLCFGSLSSALLTSIFIAI